MPFVDREDARAKARLGGLAKAAKERARNAPPPPYAGTFLEFLTDAGMAGPSWEAWRTLWRVVGGEPLSDTDKVTFAAHTGRTRVPIGPLREAWLICGRRGGKSRNLAAFAVWTAIRRDYAALLAAGERAAVAVVAADRRQAALVLRYVRGLAARPAVAPYVGRVLRDSLEFRTGCDVAVMTASHQSTRGYSLAAALCDELAFWTVDETGASPDAEVLAALRPGLATVPGAMLIGASTPYARRGALWTAYERAYAQDGEDAALVWRAPSLDMNPSLDPAVVADAYERDPAAAAAEWGAEFRGDVQAFLDVAAIRGVVIPGRHELPHSFAHRYVGFVDPSGGSSDSMTLAIAHAESRGDEDPLGAAYRARAGRSGMPLPPPPMRYLVGVLDVLREVKPPFSPDAVVQEFRDVLASYNLTQVSGDRYGGEWPRERFRRHGTRYVPATRTASDYYRELLPLVNAGRVELLDVPRLVAQLAGLERTVARGGKDQVSHAPGGHDDVANVAAGALVTACEGRGNVATITQFAGP